jgi:all-trans-retinol 13,14-reductase
MLNKTKARLTAKKEIATSIYEFIFETDDEIDFRPGQYLSLQIDEKQKRMYSILEVKSKNLYLLIDTKPQGDASKMFEKADAGFETNLIYPMGDFVLQENDNPKMFIASGTGITPMVSMIKEEMKKDLEVKPILLWGFRNDKDNYIERYLSEEIKKGLQVITCVTQPSSEYKGYVGRVTGAIKGTLGLPLDIYEAYICGNKEMVKEIDGILKSSGVDSIYFERY